MRSPKNGESFHAFLARTGTARPATFRGGCGTWQDRAERWHRLDYVGASSDALTAVSCVEVDQERTLAVQEREDHRRCSGLFRGGPRFLICASGAGFADWVKLGEAATSCCS